MEHGGLLSEYIHAAMRHARYELLEDGEGFYGEIPECRGVWANAETLEACREELQEVLEDWIVVRLARSLALPSVGGVSLGVATAS